MKARKINLKVYTVEGFDPKKGVIKVPYDVKKSLDNILLATGEATSQRLGYREALRNATIGQKILSAEDSVLLPESEFQIILRSVESYKGYGKNEVELLKRIDEAETVDVKEEKKDKGK